MNLCRDCTWWGKDDAWVGFKGSRDCALLSGGGDDAKAWGSPEAGANHAAVTTLPDFGCVQWQAKDDAKQAQLQADYDSAVAGEF